MGNLLTCHNCGYDFEVYRHTIQNYIFTHVDENIEGEYILKCPHCNTEHVMNFVAEIKHYTYKKL